MTRYPYQAIDVCHYTISARRQNQVILKDSQAAGQYCYLFCI